MAVDIIVPAVAESLTEAIVSEWLKKDGSWVKRNQPILVLDSDKASFEVIAEAEGLLKTAAAEGDTVAIGAVVGSIDPDAAKPEGADEAPAPVEAPAPPADEAPVPATAAPKVPQAPSGHLSPAARAAAAQSGVDPSGVSGTGPGGRVTKGDILEAAKKPSPPPALKVPSFLTGEEVAVVAQERQKMTPLRRRIAERLVQSQQTAAILTTFNEIDMSEVIQLRARYKESYKEKYGFSLGFMGFFTRACIEALQAYPEVNSFIEEDEVVYNNHVNMGVAVGTERGLVVPVIRQAEKLSIPEIEEAIRYFALKARDGKLAIDDMTGGTFTISNGGVYGSLMSTPIINPPQSGILGMHKIEERAVVVEGDIVARPMMYVALSYDHRIVDGQGAVGFLVRIKECIEDPERLLLGI